MADVKQISIYTIIDVGIAAAGVAGGPVAAVATAGLAGVLKDGITAIRKYSSAGRLDAELAKLREEDRLKNLLEYDGSRLDTLDISSIIKGDIDDVVSTITDSLTKTMGRYFSDFEETISKLISRNHTSLTSRLDDISVKLDKIDNGVGVLAMSRAQAPVDAVDTRRSRAKLPSGSGTPSIFELCPRCLEAARNAASDEEIRELLGGIICGDFLDYLQHNEVLNTLRVLDTHMRSGNVALPDVCKVRRLLSAIAPFHVPAELVVSGRNEFGFVAVEPRDYRGGVLDISAGLDVGADAVIRAALYDQCCAWSDCSHAHNSSPRGDHTIDLNNVPFPGTKVDDKVQALMQRIQDACKTRDYTSALEHLRELLWDGTPLAVLCDEPVVGLLKSLRDTCLLEHGVVFYLDNLALFLSKCSKAHLSMHPMLMRIGNIMNLYR